MTDENAQLFVQETISYINSTRATASRQAGLSEATGLAILTALVKLVEQADILIELNRELLT